MAVAFFQNDKAHQLQIAQYSESIKQPIIVLFEFELKDRHPDVMVDE